MPKKCQFGKRFKKKLAGIKPASFIALCLLVSGCTTATTGPQTASSDVPILQSDAGLSRPQLDQSIPGEPLATDTGAANFLVGQNALMQRDLDIAADYFTRTLAGDKANIDLLQRSFLTLYQTGQIDEAAIIARQIEATNISLPLSSEPAAIIAITNADWDAAQALSDQMLSSGGASNLAYLTSIWSKFALGQETAALSDMTRFARSITDTDIPPFMYLHLAHIAELAGQSDSAAAYLDLIINGGAESAEVILSTAASYWRLGKKDTAEQLVTDGLGGNFYAPKLLELIENETSELTRPLTLKRAIAQSILDETWLNANQSGSGLLMPHAYLALRIDPDLHAARFVLAQLYTAMNKLDLAQQILNEIPDTSVWHQPAVFLHINILIETDALAEARAVLAPEILAWPDNRRLYHLMGDLYRRERLCEAALDAYIEAEKRGDRSSTLYRSLGVCYAELDDIPLAETNLQRAIDLNPNDASALNYLGYLWADEGRNLERAQSYIEDAVRLRPDSGYYADSLGWVYYRMNELDMSVFWLEKAFQLTPGDLVISEHLADAYWRVGRWHEARYKWQYALELADETDDIIRIEAKLALDNDMTLPSKN